MNTTRTLTRRHRSGPLRARSSSSLRRRLPPPLSSSSCSPSDDHLTGAGPDPTYELHHSSYEMHTPARFSYELHRSRVGSGAGVVQSAHLRRAEPWSPPPSRRLAPAASYEMTVASPCRSPRTRRARPPRSAAAKASGSRQRFAGCRVGEYMSSGCGVYLVLIAAIKRSNE